MGTCAIILPNLDRLLASLGSQRASHIRRLIYGEQRQAVCRFQVTSIAIKPCDYIDYGSFVVT